MDVALLLEQAMGVPVAEVLTAVWRDHPRVVDDPVGPGEANRAVPAQWTDPAGHEWVAPTQRFPSEPSPRPRRPSNGASPARTFVHLRHRSTVCRLSLEAVLSTRRTGSSPQWLCSGGTQGHPRDRRPGAPPTARTVRLGPTARPGPGTRRRAPVHDHLDVADPDRRSVLGRGPRPHPPPPGSAPRCGRSP
jgi:hypothetical protein